MSLYPNPQMEKMPYEEPAQQAYEPPPPYNASQPMPPSAPMAMAGQTVTIVVDDGKFGPYPKTMKCYHCGQQVVTAIDRKAGPITWLLCSLLCIVGCFCGCCLIPFCASPTQDVLHKCPNCKKFLGAYERLKFRR